MARKLIGIETPPPGPRTPAVPVETLPTDDAGLIQLWRPQAAMRARKGESEFAIARFLHSKGVEGAAARAAAREIIANPGDTGKNGDILKRIAGFLLFTFGLLAPIGCLALGIGGFVGIAATLVAVTSLTAGCRLLWIADKNS